MNRIHAFNLVFLFLLTLFLFPATSTTPQALASSSGQDNPDDVETVTLTTATAFPEVAGENYSIFRLEEVLEERAPGYFDIDFRGGADAFPSFELYSFVQRGAVDIGNVPTSYYASDLYIAGALNLVRTPAYEWDEASVRDWADSVMNPEGIKYLGQAMGTGTSFHVKSKERIERPEDLDGLMLRGVATWRPLLEYFGADVADIPPPEIFTALERGVIDGVVWPQTGLPINLGWYEEYDYIIDPGFFYPELSLIMNLETWNDLSEAHQEAFMDAINHLEREAHEYWVEEDQKAREHLINAGIEVIEFTDEDREKWLEASYRELWKHMLERSGNPEDVRRLNEILEATGQETYFPEDH